MDIKTFKTLASNLPPHIAVLMRGPTGVGKSHMGKALADELNAVLPFAARRFRGQQRRL